MTAIEEIVMDLKNMNLRNFEMKEEDIVLIEGKKEYVTFTYYEDGRLIRFRTLRREGETIVETGYNVNPEGKLESLFSGIYHEKDTPPYRASKARYSELNKFLEEHEK